MSTKDKGGPTGKDPLRFQHIQRLVIATFLGFTVLLTAKFLLVPKTFGQFGHYRGAAVDEIRAKKPNHIGKAACLDCHDPVTADFKHDRISCETCHGPMSGHAAEQTEENSKTVFTDRECLRCHKQLAARPKFMRQVEPAVHFPKETCESCHSPHNPRPHASKGILKTDQTGKE